MQVAAGELLVLTQGTLSELGVVSYTNGAETAYMVMPEYADGGMIGEVPLSGGSSDSSSGSSGNNGDKGQIVVNMNPVFNINGEGGNDTVNSIKEKLKELINEMSGELASRLLESYANMPT